MAKKDKNIPVTEPVQTRKEQGIEQPHGDFLFENINYKILLIGLGLIVLGFILMSGGGSQDPKIWSDDVFSWRRIRLAPTVVLIGFCVTIYSILKNPKK